MSDFQNFASLQSRLINFFADKDLFDCCLFPSFKLCKLVGDGIALGIGFYYAECLLFPAGFQHLVCLSCIGCFCRCVCYQPLPKLAIQAGFCIQQIMFLFHS